jgi:hypothetical protein
MLLYSSKRLVEFKFRRSTKSPSPRHFESFAVFGNLCSAFVKFILSLGVQ